MTSPADSFDTLRRAAQAVQGCTTETNSATVHAFKGSSTMTPQSRHLDHINKILASVPHRNVKAGKEEDEVMDGPVDQGKTLVLPKNSSAPRDS